MRSSRSLESLSFLSAFYHIAEILPNLSPNISQFAPNDSVSESAYFFYIVSGSNWSIFTSAPVYEPASHRGQCSDAHKVT